MLLEIFQTLLGFCKNKIQNPEQTNIGKSFFFFAICSFTSLGGWGSGLLGDKLIEKGIAKITAEIPKYHFPMIQVSLGVYEFTNGFDFNL